MIRFAPLPVLAIATIVALLVPQPPLPATAAARPCVIRDASSPTMVVIGGRHRALPQLEAQRGVMLLLINRARRHAGLATLRGGSTVDAIAQWRSSDMVTRHYFSHQIPGQGLVFAVLKECGASYLSAGENLATNNYLAIDSFTEALTKTNADLMSSPPHRANLLNPHYSEVGIGMAIDHTTHSLILTEVFRQPS